MNSAWVNIFHVADDNACIICIPHDLILIFNPAKDTFLNEALGNPAAFQAKFNYCFKFLFCVCNTTACTAKGICRSNNERKTQIIDKVNCFCNG